MRVPDARAAELHIHSSVSTGRDELMRWSDEAHHAEALTRPGWLAAHRFVAVDAEGPLANHGYDILTVCELRSADAAVLITDHSYTPTPLPAAVTGLRSARAVYIPLEPTAPTRVPDGAVLVYVTVELDAAVQSKYLSTFRHERQQWSSPARLLAESPSSVTTLPACALGTRWVEQHLCSGGAAATSQVHSSALAQVPGAHRTIRVYRHVFSATTLLR